MASRQAHASIITAADPAAVWAIARDFCGAWHPAIETIRAARSLNGALERAFTVKGDDGLYREQLSYYSDSDRTLTYTHIEGIEGVDDYTARLTVSADPASGCKADWTAQIVAQDAVRADAIAVGTEAIFRDGLAALAGLASASHLKSAAPSSASGPVPPRSLSEVKISSKPALAVTAVGEGSGPLVIFLHGIGGRRSNWRAQLAALPEGWRGAALDLRGYGDSELGQSQSNIDDYCGDILCVATALGADAFVLCGLSYGSWIATSFAMRHPDKLLGLALSGGCTGMSDADAAERDAFRASREAPLAAGQTPADFAPALIDVLAGPDASAAVRAELLASMSAIPVATYRDALACFTNPPERFDFSRLTMPVLMVNGEHDRLASPAEIRGVANRIAALARRPSVRFEVIPGAGHVCNVVQPQAYNAVLNGWLEGLAA